VLLVGQKITSDAWIVVDIGLGCQLPATGPHRAPRIVWTRDRWSLV